MLSKVSAALVKLVKPIASETHRNVTKKREESSDFEGFQKRKDQLKHFTSKDPSLKVIKGGKEEHSEKEEDSPENSEKEPLHASDPSPTDSKEGTQEAPETTLPPNSGSQSLPQAFLKMIQLFSAQRDIMRSRVGKESYRSSSQNQVTTGKFKKGTMLDEKIE